MYKQTYTNLLVAGLNSSTIISDFQTADKDSLTDAMCQILITRNKQKVH